MSRLLVWVKASRLPAQMFIFPCLLLGQGLYYSVYQTINWHIFIYIHMYGIFMHLFIVYANDYADYDTDLINNTFNIFTGGSRVLVDGILKRESLKLSAITMFILSLVSGLIISISINNLLTFLFVLFGLKLLWAYSFPPIKLSYRGFGEVLQVIGVGIILPLVGFFGQGGQIDYVPWKVIIFLLPIQLGMAIATSMPDRPSDTLSLKRTTVVIFGNRNSKYLVVILNFLSLLSIYLLKESLSNVNGVFMYFSPVFIIALLQLFLALSSSLDAGSEHLYYFVLLAILSNVSLILLVTYLAIT